MTIGFNRKNPPENKINSNNSIGLNLIKVNIKTTINFGIGKISL